MLPLRRAAWTLAVLAAACTATPSTRRAVPARLEPEARRAAMELAATYQRAQAEDFFSLVDQSLFPDFSSFQHRVRQFLLHNRSLNIDLIIDTVVVSEGRAAVSARWNKAFVDPNGRPQKDNGECEFLLKQRPSGGLALIDIQGDSPF